MTDTKLMGPKPIEWERIYGAYCKYCRYWLLTRKGIAICALQFVNDDRVLGLSVDSHACLKYKE